MWRDVVQALRTMAAFQLLECFLEGRVSKDEILKFISKNESASLFEKLQISPNQVSSTEFIYELISFLREQSYNVIENAPKVSTTLCSPKKAIPSKRDISSNESKPKPSRILPSPAPATPTRAIENVSVSFLSEDFPALGAPVTPIKRATLKSSKSSVSQSTPVQLKGNLEVATPPLASEGIFNRSVPKTEKGVKKRAKLLLTSTPELTNPRKADNPKKRVTPIPVKRWQQESEANFISAEVSHSPKEATKQQREVVKSMNQEASSAHKEELEIPSLEFVSSKEKLDRIAELYSDCLVLNFVPNLAVELSFIMQLLVVKMRPETSRNEFLLGTASNCGYFAVQVLFRSSALLHVLEPSVLRLLKNIPHIQEMNLDLHLRLCDLCNLNQSISLFRSSFIQGVSFDATVDNSDNFPTQRHFGAFRKQRDAFYDLLKDWQKVTFESRNRESVFPKRVKSIFDLSMDPCNLLHLAKLLVLQMIATCCGSLETDDHGNTSESGALQDLRLRSPEKFSKLENRFEKSGSRSVSLKHEFSGQQAFFYSFIINANNAQFHEHLKNVLIGHIFEEDRCDIAPEDADTSIDSQIKEEICTLLYRLRLYGAFLGLLEFLAYSESVSETTPQVIETQKRMRENTSTKIDLDQCLQTALQDRKLLPTLSWISSYLSMADPVAGQLPAFQKPLKTLGSIFRSCRSPGIYSVLLRILIGSIFDNMNVPMAFSGPTVELITPSEIEIFVDIQLIYMLCPFLTNLRSIVADFYSFSLSESRKIAPVNTNDVKVESLGILTKLEEAFFFVHPSSVKKTVTFVTERVPANVLKIVRPSLVVQIRDEVKKALIDMKEHEEHLNKKLIKTLAQNLCSRFQLLAERTILTACEAQAAKLLEELLKADCNSEGIAIAKKICAKQCHLRILQWIRSYISKEYVSKEITEEMKANKMENPTNEENFEDRPGEAHYSSASVAEIIDSLQHLLQISMNSEMPPWKDSLERTRLSLRHRREWKLTSRMTVLQMLVDLGSLSIVRNVDLTIVEVVVDILNEEKYCKNILFSVNNTRNHCIVDRFCHKDRALARKLFVDYQRMLDNFKINTN